MNLGRMLLAAGILFLAAGVIVILLQKLNIPIGRMPGDITYRGKNTTVYFPIVTSILLSILVSLVLWFISRR